MKKQICRLLACLFLFTCLVPFFTACGKPTITFYYEDGVTEALEVTDTASMPSSTPARQGYLFSHFADKKGTVYSYEQLKELLANGKSKEVYAVWTEHTHTYGEEETVFATCMEAGYTKKTCTVCAHTEKAYIPGEDPLPHRWVAATYTYPKYCRYCNMTDGMPLEYLFYHNLPNVYLTTNNGILPTSKEVYSPGLFMMTDAGAYDVPDTPCGIRLRGNYSSAPEKKPYRVRFDEKISLFGKEANRSWVLLADYLDVSHIKNFAIYNFANLLDSQSFQLLTRHVSVYFNDQWLGVYMLTDQISEHEGRLDVKEDLTALSRLGDEVPFVIELDEYAPNEGILDQDYFTYIVPVEKSYNKKALKLYFSVKYPEKEERIREAQFTYIKNYTTAALNAVFELSNEDWRDYWDEDSMIDYFLANQWGSNGEISWKSVFLSKGYQEKLKMGPVWDFDWGVGGPNWVYPNTQWETFCNTGPDVRGNAKIWRSNAWFSYLWSNDAQFVVNFYHRWQEVRPYTYRILAELRIYKPVIAAMIDMEMVAWNRCQSEKYLNHPYGKASGQYEVVLQILEEQIAFLDQKITSAYNVAKNKR